MKNLILILLTFVCFNLQAQFDGSKKAIVITVHDGDSYGIKFLDRLDTTVYIRLHNIDAPEVVFYVIKDQPYARQSAKAIRDLIKGDTIDVTFSYKDTFKRLVCDVKKDSIDLTEYAIANGLAWYESDKATELERLEYLKSLQKKAQEAKIGLWGEPGRKLRPATWRRRYSRL